MGVSCWDGISDDLTGDVYQLASEEVQAVLASDSKHISGAIWLSDTFRIHTTSFITIPITNELTDQLITNRPQVACVYLHRPWRGPIGPGWTDSRLHLLFPLIIINGLD